MSNRFNNGSHYENHQRAAEMHNLAAHAHRAADQHGQGEHLTSHEQSRLALEHSQRAHEHSQMAHEHSEAHVNGQGAGTSHHEDVSALAYELWVSRGRPEGSSEQDWFEAVNKIGSRSL
jgi:hypothetical protein